MNEKKQQTKRQVLNIVGIALIVILIPILIINCTLLIKGMINEDEVPSFGNISPLIVLSGSMEEDFPEGSLIFTKKVDASEVKDGDIISYFDPVSKTCAVVTHKVKFIKTTEDGKRVFYTYGTANTFKTHEEITESDCDRINEKYFIGKYTGVHFKGIGKLAMFMQSVPGLIICILVPLGLFVGYDLYLRKKSEKANDDDKEALLKELEELRKLKAEQEKTAENNE